MSRRCDGWWRAGRATVDPKRLGVLLDGQHHRESDRHGAHFTVDRRRLFSLPKVGAKTAGYRVSGSATTTCQIANAYLDVVVLAHGRTVTAISFASLEQGFPSRMESRLARIVADHISAH